MLIKRERGWGVGGRRDIYIYIYMAVLCVLWVLATSCLPS